MNIDHRLLLPDSVFIERDWQTDRFDVIAMRADTLEFVTLASGLRWLEAVEFERRWTQPGTAQAA